MDTSLGSHRALPSLSTTPLYDRGGSPPLPSPTFSEAEALAPPKSPWSRENLLKRENIRQQLVKFAIIGVFVVLTIYQNQILQALQPAANWMRNTPGGWLIPVALLIILSVPPLIGHEIILTLVGFTWGIGIGIAIGIAGTIIGELFTFYLFQYACAARMKKREQKNIQHACLAQVVRDGGWKIATIFRYSAIPSHLTTALFSTCGMSVWTFLVSAVLSLPKQIATVIFGWALKQSGGSHNTTSKIVQWVIIVVTTVVTILAMRYVRTRQTAVAHEVVFERRKRRAELLRHSGIAGTGSPNVYGSSGPAYPPSDVYKP